MNGKSTLSLCSTVLVLIGGLGTAHADECFKASGAMGEDAQTIRQKAASMGWTVGTPASLTAAGVVKGKVALYPKGSVEVCLRPAAGNELALRVQASSSDAGNAEWHKLPAKRTG